MGNRLLLYASLYEGMGIAALEALVCGVPAVLSRFPGFVDVADLTDAVWFVEPTPMGVEEGNLNTHKSLDAATSSAVTLAPRVIAERTVEKAIEKVVETYRSV